MPMRLGQQQKAGPSKGSQHGVLYRKTAVSLDHEMFNDVRETAIEYDCSFAEAVRTLLQWGLEAKQEYDK